MGETGSLSKDSEAESLSGPGTIFKPTCHSWGQLITKTDEAGKRQGPGRLSRT